MNSKLKVVLPFDFPEPEREGGREVKKIPTVFERDWNGDRSRVVNQVHPGCEWVLAGEGVPTRKVDGVCCALFGGVWLKRRELKPGQAAPEGFILADHDDETGKSVGWVPIGEGPEDKFMREAIADFSEKMQGAGYFEGTCEFLGPKSQGNVENVGGHMMLPHAWCEKLNLSTGLLSFDYLRGFLETFDGEGIVWHHPDGRMAKLKKRDFGFKR